MEQQNQFSEVEIKAVNLMIKQACQVLLDEKTTEQVAIAAKKGDPVKAIVDVVVPVLRQVYAAAQAGGAKVDIQKCAVLAGREAVKILVAVLGAAGIVKPEQAQQIVAQAYVKAVQTHNQSAQGGEQQAPAQEQPQQAPQPSASGGGLIAQGA